MKEGLSRAGREASEGDRLATRPDCSDRLAAIHSKAKLTKLHTLNELQFTTCQFIYFNKAVKMYLTGFTLYPPNRHGCISVWLCQIDLIRNSLFLYLLLWYESHFAGF